MPPDHPAHVALQRVLTANGVHRVDRSVTGVVHGDGPAFTLKEDVGRSPVLWMRSASPPT